ncbi:stage II sporulation protein P [Sporomusa aerivorans]|uniref:stage II sporulation protein P n=1 Tax=Sporomusa aerivorans TaxID=204936 RepID=UPI00352A41BF
MQKGRLVKLIGILALITVIAAGVIHYVPLNLFTVQQKPEQPPQKVYDYYIIRDESTNEILMYVPIVVSIDDELISESNKRYKIVKIEENQAYARFVEDLNLKVMEK